MNQAIKETNRRRAIQLDYNKTHNITPKSIQKKHIPEKSNKKEAIDIVSSIKPTHSPSELLKQIKSLEKQMKQVADNLNFELAAVLRDKIEELTKKHIKLIYNPNITYTIIYVRTAHENNGKRTKFISKRSCIFQ